MEIAPFQLYTLSFTNPNELWTSQAIWISKGSKINNRYFYLISKPTLGFLLLVRLTT